VELFGSNVFFSHSNPIPGGGEDAPTLVVDISDGFSIALQAQNDAESEFVFPAESMGGQLYIFLRWCTSGQFPAVDDSSFVAATTSLTVWPELLDISWTNAAGSVVTKDGRCLQMEGHTTNVFDKSQFPLFERLLFTLSIPANATMQGKRAYGVLHPSIVALRLRDPAGPFTKDPGPSCFVSDVQPPVITCPSNVQVAAPYGESNVNVIWEMPVASDNAVSRNRIIVFGEKFAANRDVHSHRQQPAVE
jgi:hypothetical protein